MEGKRSMPPLGLCITTLFLNNALWPQGGQKAAANRVRQDIGSRVNAKGKSAKIAEIKMGISSKGKGQNQSQWQEKGRRQW